MRLVLIVALFVATGALADGYSYHRTRAWLHSRGVDPAATKSIEVDAASGVVGGWQDAWGAKPTEADLAGVVEAEAEAANKAAEGPRVMPPIEVPYIVLQAQPTGSAYVVCVDNVGNIVSVLGHSSPWPGDDVIRQRIEQRAENQREAAVKASERLAKVKGKVDGIGAGAAVRKADVDALKEAVLELAEMVRELKEDRR